jgi:hypothetical protein
LSYYYQLLNVLLEDYSPYLFIPFEKLSLEFESTGLIDIDITGSGTCIDSMVSFRSLSVTNVSPVEQSIPNRAQMSPAKASSMSFLEEKKRK